MSQTQFRSQPSPALQSMFSETSLYLSGCQATESFPLSAWLASGSSLWRWGQNLHFKPPWLPPLLQSASHKNVMAAIEHTGPRRDLAGITRSLPNPTGQTRPVVTVWRSPRNLCVWLFYTLTPFQLPDISLKVTSTKCYPPRCNAAPRREKMTDHL